MPKFTVPSFLPSKGWSVNNKGYVIFSSRVKGAEIRRGAKIHRVVLRHLIGRELQEDEHIHHMDFNKKHNCPCNLLIVPACMNPSNAKKDPFSGQFLSQREWVRRYGLKSDEPDWVRDGI